MQSNAMELIIYFHIGSRRVRSLCVDIINDFEVYNEVLTLIVCIIPFLYIVEALSAA